MEQVLVAGGKEAIQIVMLGFGLIVMQIHIQMYKNQLYLQMIPIMLGHLLQIFSHILNFAIDLKYQSMRLLLLG